MSAMIANDATSRAIGINLVADLIFAALVAAARWLTSAVSGADPRRRKLSLVSIPVLWVVSNLIYWLSDFPLYTLFLLAATLICAGICYRELHQFWRLDLVGADAQIRDGLNYEKSLRMCTSSLEFLGIGASKLTGNTTAFEESISRCERPGRPIRLLLSRPDYDGLLKIARKAGVEQDAYQQRVRTSLLAIAELKSHEKNIQVRFYREFPAFRLMFINDEILLASHYVLGKGDGSQLPQLQIVKTSASRDVTSLYYAFHEYFESIWEHSEEWDFKAYL